MKFRLIFSVICSAAVVLILFAGAVGMGEYFGTGGVEPVSAEQTFRESVLIIDPGHGGADGGAVSITGALESDINLAISLKIESLAAFFGYPAVMTRSDADIDYPDDADTIRAKKVADVKARTELVNSFENAVLLSIHQNKYTDGGPSGAEALYAPTTGSEAVAESVQNALNSGLDLEKNRTFSLISPDIYLMNHINCPAVLVECGFISNSREAVLLEDPEYQTKLTVLILGGLFNGAGLR